MFKDHMNADQKQAFVLLSAAGTTIGAALDQIETHVPKPVAADLKRSRSFLKRALEAWIEPMNENTRSSILRISRDTKIGVVNNRTSKLDRENYERYLFGREHFEDMAEITLQAVCSKCDGVCRDTCKLFAAYTNFDLTPWDVNHPHCPYAGVGTVNEDANLG